ncbi:MAG: hypothetical protein RLZZ624_47 [Cyanobacteriota bacterium]|jgi:hypothetical protein
MADLEANGSPQSPAADHRSPSIWEQKPWWCQPWSILGTGITVVALSWLALQIWWLSAATALAVAAWWWLFLLAVPAAYRQQFKTALQAGSEIPPENKG